MKALFHALSFLSILPMPGMDRPRDGAVFAAYPWAGLVLGGCTAAIAWLTGLVLGVWGTVAAVMAARIVLTGGLHLDGLADLADGLGGGSKAQKCLEIMKDSRIGSYGVLALITMCGLQAAFIAEWLADRNFSVLPLILVPGLSRGAVPALMRMFPFAREGGLGAALGGTVSTAAAIFAAAGAGLAAGLLYGGIGLGLWGGVSLLMTAGGALVSRKLGGLTGDCYGAIIELGDMLGYLGAVILL
ncbi:MAG: hypothetical protein B0D92_05865 [Spirochaeta sp. LUC14_002_19_P3]|nr:MAG: hypothetical protein B0D92_05865 [Spirochaeta sp. LUC14_002_19_P3]